MQGFLRRRHPFSFAYLAFILALLPCCPALGSCVFGLVLCKDPGMQQPQNSAYMAAPLGVSTNSASGALGPRSPQPNSRLSGRRTGGRHPQVVQAVAVANPYPTSAPAPQADYRRPQNYSREGTIGS